MPEQAHPLPGVIDHLRENQTHCIKGFLKMAYAARGELASPRSHSTMRVIIDCSWMPRELANFGSSRVTQFLIYIHPTPLKPTRNMFVMLDWKQNDNRQEAAMMSAMADDINHAVQSSEKIRELYGGNVEMLLPSQGAFFETKKSSLAPLLRKRKSGNDRCFCSEILIDQRFGHTPRGKRCTAWYKRKVDATKKYVIFTYHMSFLFCQFPFHAKINSTMRIKTQTTRATTTPISTGFLFVSFVMGVVFLVISGVVTG